MSDSIAFTVQGIGITAAQRDAALAAMTGTFRASDVAAALLRAGVPQETPRNGQWRSASADYVPERAADRLLQTMRRSGQIRAVANKLWERVHV